MVGPGVHEPSQFPCTALLERGWEQVRSEVLRLDRERDFQPSPDSLTTVADGYDETGWRWFGLFGDDARFAAHRTRCPATSAACAAVPGLVNAGFSLFRPGTRLYPHQGELRGVLRCHLALLVPAGDVGLRLAGVTHRWVPGRCLVFDDTIEHEAWNRGDGDRIVLLVTFHPMPSGA